MHPRSGRAPRRQIARAAIAWRTTFLPRPARLGDFPEPVENLILSAADRVEHVKRAAFGENQMPRIGPPGRILAGADDLCSAATEIEHCDLKFAAASHVERHLLPIRRPA